MNTIHEIMQFKFSEVRRLTGLTQSQLGAELGVTQAQVSRLMNGQSELTEEKILGICRVLGLRWQDLDVDISVPEKAQFNEYALYPSRTHAELHRTLQRILANGRKNHRDAVSTVIEAIEACVQAKDESEPVTVQSEPTAAADNVIRRQFEGKPENKVRESVLDYSDPRQEHDEPQPEHYEELPFFDEFRVPASPPDEVPSDGRRSVHKVLHHLAKGNRYVIRVRGDSMSPRIEDGDLLLVDYAKQPQPNDVVIALLNGKAMVKKFIRKDGHILLRSTNADYQDIPVQDGDELQIAGVVLKIVEGDL